MYSPMEEVPQEAYCTIDLSLLLRDVSGTVGGFYSLLPGVRARLCISVLMLAVTVMEFWMTVIGQPNDRGPRYNC
jgi:hypothetical protein